MSVLKRILSLAVTPLCVAVLLAEPSSRANTDNEPSPAEEGVEHHIVNPIQNFADFGYRHKNAEGGEWREGEHKMPPPFSMALVNFVVFAILMYKAGGPSIAKMTRERHDHIARALEEGKRLRDEAKAKLDQYDRKLAGLQGEIDELIASIRAEAEAEKKRIIADAEVRAERMRRDAEQQIQAEMARVRLTLEREAVEAAVSIAERVLTEKTTEADQRLLADRFVKGLAETSSTGGGTPRRRA